jgi:NAD(P)-dependent dehydrogenase (short-subunit alcohol dehydrogenase family)
MIVRVLSIPVTLLSCSARRVTMTMGWGPFSLDERVAVVTGGGRGIGRSVATRLVQAGAAVLVVDIDPGAVEKAVTELSESGGRAAGVVADITTEQSGPEIVARCQREFGRLDVLVNNAGIYPVADIQATGRDLLERVLALNLTGALLLVRAAKDVMAAAGGGSIVNVASIDGVSPTSPGFLAYSASKGALLAATRALSLELAPLNIRVNAVSPSGTMTDGVRGALDAMTEQHRARALAMLTDKVPLGRMAEPDDIATVVTFFASDASRFVTGANLIVDGGQLRGPA